MQEVVVGKGLPTAGAACLRVDPARPPSSRRAAVRRSGGRPCIRGPRSTRPHWAGHSNRYLRCRPSVCPARGCPTPPGCVHGWLYHRLWFCAPAGAGESPGHLPTLGPARESGSGQQDRRIRAIETRPAHVAPSLQSPGRQPGSTGHAARAAGWALAILALGLAYGQSPLVSSNQNQYFLHGAARAGIGFLRQDWLAATADPTPVFSAIVEWTYRLLTPAAFHFEYLLLFGVYLAGLWLLADSAFGLRRSAGRTLSILGPGRHAAFRGAAPG